MNCEKYSEWISLYIDGELEEVDCAILEEHATSCDSCREEIQIIREITNNMQDIEMMDLPEHFHKDLMEKIIPLPIQTTNWYTNLKIVSAVAAVFIFSTILLDPFKMNPPKDSMPEMASIEESQEREDNTVGSRMIMEPPVDSVADLPVNPQSDATVQSFDVGEVQGETFSMERAVMDEIGLETNPEMWIIQTPKYEEYKETIAGIAREMNLEVIIVEESGSGELKTQNITIEITLEDYQKVEFEAKIKELDQAVDIMMQQQIEQQKEEKHEKVKLVIIISQSN